MDKRRCVALGSDTKAEWGGRILSAAPDLELLAVDEQGRLEKQPDDLDAFLLSYDLYFAGLGSQEATGRMAEIAGQARWVQTGSAGWDGPVLREVFAAAKTFCNASGIHAVPIAQWVLGQMLRRCKRMDDHAASQQQGLWQINPGDGELTGRVLGIWGLGGIGQEVARLGKAVGMEVWGLRRSSVPCEHVDRLLSPEQADTLVAGADYLVMALPHSEQTQGVLDARRLALMQPTASVLNVGRGTAIVMADLHEALRAQQIGWAAVDVTDPEPLPADSPWWKTPNLVITPHDSAHSRLTGERLVDLFIDNLRKDLHGEALINQIRS